MNGSVHSLYAHKQTPTNGLLNPIASSAIDHGLSHQSSPYGPYPNCHYAPSTTYAHPIPPPHHSATNGTAATAYRLNPAGWDGATHDKQRVDHMPPRGFAPGAVHSPGLNQEYHAHLSRANEDGSFERPVWYGPAAEAAVRMDTSLAHPFPSISRSSYSDERSCEYPLSWS